MREEIVAAIAAERADQLGALASVAADDWDRPTVCSGWSVKDVLAHMVEGELVVGRIYRGEVRELGYVDPEDGIERWRALPGEAIRAAYWQHGTATQRALEVMSDESWRAQIRALGCRTIGQLARLQLFDLSVHGHDLTEALGIPPVWGNRLGIVAEFVVRAAPLTLRRLGAAPDGALAIATADAAWTIDGRSGEWTLSDEPAPATLRIEPALLVLATTGRASIDEAAQRIEGDTDLGRRILSAWQVVAPTPPGPSR